MAWTKASVNGYARWSESLVVPDPGGAVEASVSSSVIDATDLDLGGKQILAQIEVTETSGANGALDVRVQGSLDKDQWVTLDAAAGLAVNSTGLNKGVGLLDLTNIYAPYYRLQVFTNGTDILDTATVTLKIGVNAQRP